MLILSFSYCFFLILNTGIEEIKLWTKESLKSKSFSTAKGKIWTERPSSIPLKHIYTKLNWLKRKEDQVVVKEELSDITELLGEQQLQQQKLKEKTTVRIGVKGIFLLQKKFISNSFLIYMYIQAEM